VTYRQIAKIADLSAKKDKYEARQMALGKMPLPGSVRPALTTTFDRWLYSRSEA
jgi:hypothetical protein